MIQLEGENPFHGGTELEKNKNTLIVKKINGFSYS